ncbi:MAG: preprotein translocase subunit SecG [Lentisphaerae bacterium]|nr:preprotein translocase subunit SecG [Lentisphaerota bacterium]
MTVLRFMLLFIEVVSAFLLVGVILLQKSKQQGAGMMFGAGVGESLFGAQVGNVLTRTTVVLAVIFLVNTTALAYLGARRAAPRSVTDGIRSTPTESARGPAAPSSPAGQPGGGIEAPLDAGIDETVPMEVPVPDMPSAAMPAAGTMSESGIPADGGTVEVSVPGGIPAE